MTPAEFDRTLHQGIPLTAAMGIEVVAIGPESVVLRAPLRPNINPHGTLFGGSAATVALVAAWSLVHLRLRAADVTATEVIQASTMDYLLPVTGDFTARAALSRPGEWPAFERMVARKGRGRIEVTAVIEQAGEVAGRFVGRFVALREGH